MKTFKGLLSTALVLGAALCVNAQDQDTTKIWTIKGENSLLLNQSSFSNWAAGGTNAFAGNIVLNYDFNYKKNKWSWDNKVIAAYGQTFQKETDWRKNDDRLLINSLLGYDAAQYWKYTFFTEFKTQFANGYDFTTDPEKLISSGFAPAYLSFGPGFAYKRSDDFNINISPAAARFVFVTNDKIDETFYGLDEGKKSRFELGASIRTYYKLNIMENIALENILGLYSNYLEDPQNVDVDYIANLVLKVNDFISVNAGVQLLYDDNTLIDKVENGISVGQRPTLQVKQTFGAGFTYKF